jgi:hypothetical protein
MVAHKYRDMSPEEQEELFSNYLIDSWSYSKVSTFARNEKAFEMLYIYNIKSKLSPVTVAGQAYHSSLDIYFSCLINKIDRDIVDLEKNAFEYIEDIPADLWKIQKTTPSIEECKLSATKIVSVLLRNFMSEITKYKSEIKKVICSEYKFSTWLKINGVDIPLPCHIIIDRVVETNDGKTVIIDDKSKRLFSDEQDIKFSASKQAIIYTLGYESETGKKIDEVWFIENKYAKNRHEGSQLEIFKIIMDDGTRRLYEAMLYEPLRRMIEAISNPDYVYLINENDNFIDKAEIHIFWAKTMISEIEDFDVQDSKKEMIKERLRKIRDSSLATISPTILKNFKKYTEQFIPYDLSNKDMKNEEKIEHVLRSFGIISKVQHIFEGYSSYSYLLEVNAGVPISIINRHKLDIANALNVSNVRIYKDLFVHNGKSYLAIESVKINSSNLYWDSSKLEGSRIPLGMDNFKQIVAWDYENHSTPHMLVCGATGSGKTIFLKSTVEYALLGDIEDIYIFDPKYEFTDYSSINNVNVFYDIEDIEMQMMLLVEEMELRVKSGSKKTTLIFFDEFADAVANSKKGKELDIIKEVQDGYYAPKKIKGMFGDSISDPIPKMKMKVVGRKKTLEENLKILLQKGRSSGFRIIAATQRASTKVITGDAKVNFPIQVCFRVPKDIDSMVVIDEPGAEALNGRGDGLIKSPEYLNIIRFQGFYKK